MKIETQPREDHQVKLVAELDSETMEKYRQQAARKISKDTKVPGFRPGKAPFAVVRRMYGDEAINNQAVELMIDDVYPQVLRESGINPGGMGSLDEIVSMEPPTFSFIVPLAPIVELGDYRSVRVDYKPEEVTEEDINNFIDRLRSSYATVVPSEGPAQEGDMVFVNLSGNLVDPKEGDDPVVVKESPFQMVIQSEDKQPVQEWPFPGFARQLLGTSEGEEKKINYTYPEDAAYEQLRGRDVEFDVKIQSVKKMELPELNNEFAQQLGEFQTVDDLRAQVRKNLEENAREQYDQVYFTQVMDKILEDAKVKYAPQSVDEEIQEVLKNTEHNLSHENMDLETYLKTREMDRETFIEQEVRPVAVRRLERSLVIEKLIQEEKIALDVDRLQDLVGQTMQQIRMDQEYQQVRKKVSEAKLTESVTYDAANRIMNLQILERVKAIASGQADAAAEPAEATTEEEAPKKEKAPAKPRAKRQTKTKEAPKEEAQSPDTEDASETNAPTDAS